MSKTLYALEGALREDISPSNQDYHWALVLAPMNAPKGQQCFRFRFKIVEAEGKSDRDKEELEKMTWECDRSWVPLSRHDDIIARVLISGVKCVEKTEKRIQAEEMMQSKTSGRIRTSKDWVHRVIDDLNGRLPLSGGIVTTDWKKVESCCTSFAKKVLAQDAVRTFGLLEHKEVYD
ncbi:hypothetical protein IMSHALPRED_004912 [Imshaugia aleurites]|uniref:Uncharacterized protein n=1 Tax=Imshaugia aleurites TaxID=172621 RepID=A0A8H3IGZ3_9LECA|nr:hypothetical protein IMSHALPRED_004912 [Imshaugia aleurites]